ncbi:MAG: SufE family protein [Ectothiorhodospiraceae bacterium]|nr:SufE family protein [Ectothiorhodospiraceae bacterium]MCH8503571.1 SufE family protein [Ectothiorhodospiraceae bacterium]
MQLSTITPTPVCHQVAALDTLRALTDWNERYHYLLDLGERMPSLPASRCQGCYRVPGCASGVWIAPSGDALLFGYLGAAQCPMDAGLMALAMSVYSGRSAEDIVAMPPRFIDEAGLEGRFTHQRLRGLCTMVERMRDLALRCLVEARIPVGGGSRAERNEKGVRVLRFRAP